MADKTTIYAATLKAVQDGFLTTATELLTISQYEIQAAKRGMKYREGSY